ncbi:MAG: hypothetical protein ABIQ39_03040, partial [Ilumatobacteraceae bacterium]
MAHSERAFDIHLFAIHLFVKHLFENTRSLPGGPPPCSGLSQLEPEMSVALTVVVPRRLAIPASDAVFRKRRIAVVVVLAIVLALGIGVGQALASRGGVPASTST